MTVQTKASGNGVPATEGVTNRISPIQTVVISKPIVHRFQVELIGITPLLMCRMSEKVGKAIRNSGKERQGKAKKKEERDPPEVQMNDARHISVEGWDGIHCGSFRGAMIDAARSVEEITMVELKQAIFVKADGFGAETGEPLVRIDGDGPKIYSNICRNSAGTALPRHRPIYMEWGAILNLEINGAILSVESAMNLLAIAGQFCGIGEWRPSAPKSKTGDFGRFVIKSAG